MVMVPVGAKGPLQFSTTPFSCVRFDDVPVNVKVEERQVLISLAFSVRVTPLTVSVGIL